LPFGCKTASQTYQRVMDEVLRPHYEYAGAYIDDTACFSLGWAAHLIHLENVLKSFESIGMSLKFSKCRFAMDKVKFIGHEVGSGTRSPLTDKVLAIKALPEPHTKRLLRSFLGMMNFYRMYIPKYSEIAVPLTELTKNGHPNKISFNESQRKAFMLLKEKLCNCTNLCAVNFNKCFHVFTDASDKALGIAVTQMADDGTSYCPLAFASSKFSSTQERWSTIEKESYAIIYALRKFEHILHGCEIFLWCDHNPLSYITSVAPQSAKLTRWALCLSKFNISVRHIDGKSNVVADFLSRACI